MIKVKNNRHLGFSALCLHPAVFQVHHQTPARRVHSKKHPLHASVMFLYEEDQCTDLNERCICLHNLKDWMLILMYLHSHSLQLTETYIEHVPFTLKNELAIL